MPAQISLAPALPPGPPSSQEPSHTQGIFRGNMGSQRGVGPHKAPLYGPRHSARPGAARRASSGLLTTQGARLRVYISFLRLKHTAPWGIRPGEGLRVPCKQNTNRKGKRCKKDAHQEVISLARREYGTPHHLQLIEKTA